MGSNQARAREMKVPLLERRQNDRKLPSRPRDRDSFVRDTFGEVEHVDAIIEHRGARLLEVEPPRIDLPQMGDELGLEVVVALDQVVQMQQELSVGETLENTVQSSHENSPRRDRGMSKHECSRGIIGARSVFVLREWRKLNFSRQGG